MEPLPGRTYRPGSREAFDQLYRDCYPRLVRTLYAVLGDLPAAEDCVQDAFVKAFRAWDRFKPDRPAEVWLHRIAVNTAFSFRRRQQLRELPELIRRLGRPQPVPDPADAAAASDLLRALARLPPKLSIPFLLRHYHGYSTAEVAVITGSPERTVRHHLEQGAVRLRAALGSDWENRLPKSRPAGVVQACGEGARDV